MYCIYCLQPADVIRVSDKKTVLRTLLFSLLPLVLIAFLSVVVFWLYRVRKTHAEYGDQSDQYKDQPLISPFSNTFPTNDLTSSMSGSDIKLLEVKAKGRLSCVWKAQLMGAGGDGQKCVAVKVVALSERASWLTERYLYSLAGVRNHDNILCFIDGLALDLELWIIMEYHERGSLYDHLKACSYMYPYVVY